MSFSFIIFVVVLSNAHAQAPEKFSYQAVIRDANDQLITDQTIGMQLSILEGDINGSSVYSESQTPTTNDNGLVSIEIGNGNVISGDMSSIDWDSGPYFLKRQIDPLGGTDYTISGTSELLSVPYALYANDADVARFSLNTLTNVDGSYVLSYQWPGNENGNNPTVIATTNANWLGDRNIIMIGYVYVEFDFPQAAITAGVDSGTADVEMYLQYDGQTVFPIQFRNFQTAGTHGSRVTLPLHWMVLNSTAGNAKQFTLYGAENKSMAGAYSMNVNLTVVFSWIEL